MGESWFVRPKTCRLPLSEGQSIVVKQQLTAGEFRAHLRRSSVIDDHGTRTPDVLLEGLSLVVAYLVDWSLDAPIAGITEADLVVLIESLDVDRFKEIKKAIEAHVEAINLERTLAKKASDGETISSATSPSPSNAAGVLTGSAT